MTDFKTLVQVRRSHRKFTSAEISGDDVKLILRAALMSPTAKSNRGWQFVVVDDKCDLEKLADARTQAVSLSRVLLWQWWCWVIPCKTTAG